MHSRKRVFWCFLFVGGFISFAYPQSTYAEESGGGPLPATFDSSQTQAFHLDLSLVNASVSVSGTGKVRNVINNPFGADDLDFELNHPSNQNIPLSLNGGTVHFNSAPDGSATLGFDHSNPNGPGRSISNLDVDFRNGANWGFNFNPFTVRVGFDSGLGSSDADVVFSTVANLNQFLFSQSPGAATVSSSGFYNTPGDVTFGFAAAINAVANDVIFGVDFDLGNVIDFNESSTTALGLVGGETLTPQGSFPQDLQAKLELGVPFAFNLPLNQSGNVVSSSGNTSFNLNYALTGTLVLSNLSYSLQDTLVGAVVPEPSTLFLTGLGLSGVVASRRRRRPVG